MLQPKKYSRPVSLMIKYIVIVTAVVLIITRTDLYAIGRLMKGISPFFFLITVIIAVFDKVYLGLKWKLLLNVFNVNTGIIPPVIVYLKSKVFNFIAPTNLGVDVYKAYYIKKRSDASLIEIVSSIVIERTIGALSSLGIVALMFQFVVIPLQLENPRFLITCGWLFFVVLTLFIMFAIMKSSFLSTITWPRWIPRKVQYLLERFVIALSSVHEHRQKIMFYYFLSMIEKLFYGLSVFFAIMALRLEGINCLFIISATPLLAFLERLPISVASIGIREGLFVILLQPFFNSPSTAIAVALVIRSAEIAMILFSLIFWFLDIDKKLNSDEMNAVSKEFITTKMV